MSSDAQSLRTRARALDHGGYDALGDTKPRDCPPDIALARARFAEEFTLWQRLGDEAGMARSLRGSAHVRLPHRRLGGGAGPDRAKPGREPGR